MAGRLKRAKGTRFKRADEDERAGMWVRAIEREDDGEMGLCVRG